MARIVFTANLQRHLDCPAAEVRGATAREALDAYFAGHPRARRYILDDQGALQRHVNVFVDGEPVRDRRALSDTVSDATVFVLQALSGG
jgi:sulfur-carrier protein